MIWPRRARSTKIRMPRQDEWVEGQIEARRRSLSRQLVLSLRRSVFHPPHHDLAVIRIWLTRGKGTGPLYPAPCRYTYVLLLSRGFQLKLRYLGLTVQKNVDKARACLLLGRLGHTFFLFLPATALWSGLDPSQRFRNGPGMLLDQVSCQTVDSGTISDHF